MSLIDRRMDLETDPWQGGLPDPDTEAQFYDGVPLKRLIAWAIDVTVIAILSLVLVPFTAFTALFYLPVFMALVGFLYRWASLGRLSATPGMRLVGIELRTAEGRRLDLMTALLHVAGYATSMAVFPLQLLSMALMVVTPRKQGLTDHVLGTAAIRRAASD